MKQIKQIIIIVIVIFLIWWLWRWNKKITNDIHRKYLNGYWETTPSYCLNADLKLGAMYIDGDEAYLILVADDPIVNETVKFKLCLVDDNNLVTYSLKHSVDIWPQDGVQLIHDCVKNELNIVAENSLLLQCKK